jgi:hypothetical protein
MKGGSVGRLDTDAPPGSSSPGRSPILNKVGTALHTFKVGTALPHRQSMCIGSLRVQSG